MNKVLAELTKLYDQYKKRKASKHPNDYLRGFEDGWNKAVLDNIKTVEDLVAENYGIPHDIEDKKEKG